jgi:hypothetical protein
MSGHRSDCHRGFVAKADAEVKLRDMASGQAELGVVGQVISLWREMSERAGEEGMDARISIEEKPGNSVETKSVSQRKGGRSEEGFDESDDRL